MGSWGERLRAATGRGFSPVKRFALLSLFPFVGLGMLLSSTIHGTIESRYLTMYAQSAEFTITSVASVILSDPSLEDHVLKSGPGEFTSTISGLTGVIAYTPQGTVAFAEASTVAYSKAPLPGDVRRALASDRPLATFTSTVPSYVSLRGPVIELAIPIRQGDTVVGVVHGYRSAAQLEAEITDSVTDTNLLLGAGLGLIWLLLFPVVVSASRRLRRQALHDSLTGLANRYLFADRLAQAMASADRRNEKVGLLLLDLDRFKEVNDGLGHQHGDELLRQVATALGAQVRNADTLARLGGDEFAAVLTGIHCEQDGFHAAQRLMQALETPIMIEGVAVTPQASVGMSIYPDHGTDADSLLGKADMAMYTAKGAHQSFAVYKPERDFSIPAHLALVTELRRALAGEEVICHYQPLVRMLDQQVLGVEALVRWVHPTRGLVCPAEFLPVVEQSGMTKALTSRVLQVALRQCRMWLDEGLDLIVAVNISPRSLRDSGLPELVFAALDDEKVPAANLELEITEEALLEDPVQAKVILQSLADRGVRLALDDFGTGYSSLAYLSQLPVSKVKIDRAFLVDMDTDEMNEKIVEMVVDLGRRLGMDVLAEGVETSDVWDRLVEIGCPQAQGFYLARPMPPEELASWRYAHISGAPAATA